jgi:hypothetical protein
VKKPVFEKTVLKPVLCHLSASHFAEKIWSTQPLRHHWINYTLSFDQMSVGHMFFNQMTQNSPLGVDFFKKLLK